MYVVAEYNHTNVILRENDSRINNPKVKVIEKGDFETTTHDIQITHNYFRIFKTLSNQIYKVLADRTATLVV